MSDDATPRPQVQKADTDLQRQREKTIEGFKSEGVIHKVDGETVAKLHVRPRFYTMAFDDKKTVAHLAYSWFYKIPMQIDSKDLNPGDHVQIIDFANGNKVGEYDPINGLSMDK